MSKKIVDGPYSKAIHVHCEGLHWTFAEAYILAKNSDAWRFEHDCVHTASLQTCHNQDGEKIIFNASGLMLMYYICGVICCECRCYIDNAVDSEVVIMDTTMNESNIHGHSCRTSLLPGQRLAQAHRRGTPRP